MSSFDVCDLVLDSGKKQFNLKSSQSSSSRPKGATKPTKKGTLKPWVLKGWQKEFSWLCYDAGADVVSCKFCSIEWPAANVRKIQLSTHAKTFKHLKDAKGVEGATDSENAAALRLAPSVHEFRETISQRLKGCSFRDANQGSKREQKMTWCVGEALRERQRKMLRKAHCVCGPRCTRISFVCACVLLLWWLAGGGLVPLRLQECWNWVGSCGQGDQEASGAVIHQVSSASSWMEFQKWYRFGWLYKTVLQQSWLLVSILQVLSSNLLSLSLSLSWVLSCCIICCLRKSSALMLQLMSWRLAEFWKE